MSPPLRWCLRDEKGKAFTLNCHPKWMAHAFLRLPLFYWALKTRLSYRPWINGRGGSQPEPTAAWSLPFCSSTLLGAKVSGPQPWSPQPGWEMSVMGHRHKSPSTAWQCQWLKNCEQRTQEAPGPITVCPPPPGDRIHQVARDQALSVKGHHDSLENTGEGV